MFVGDNAAGAAPEILEALAREAAGPARSYGADPVTARLEARLKAVFETDLRVMPVATGTAANALSLATLCPPWGAVYCHPVAHVSVDECGAPEFFSGGAKLTLIEGPSAKIDPGALADALSTAAAIGVHNVQPAAVSISQPTELGAVYSPAEIGAIADIARGAGLPLHMDGARFANAVAALGSSPADLTWRAGVDILCLGATKNGALAAEAVILFDPARAWEFALRRKRGGHLFSKMRFLSAQLEAWLADDLWLRLAGHANAMARRLAGRLRPIPGVEILHPVEANMIFAAWPRAGHRALAAAGAVYYAWPHGPSLAEGPDDEIVPARLVCSFQTEAAEVDGFADALLAALSARAEE